MGDSGPWASTPGEKVKAANAALGVSWLPNFVGAGAEKAGAMSLFRVLEQRRDVFMPRHKETPFLTGQRHWESVACYEAPRRRLHR